MRLSALLVPVPVALAAVSLAAVSLAGVSCVPGAPTCSSNDDCGADLICALDAAQDRRICAEPCAADSRCEAGTACVRVDGALEGVCLDVTGNTGLGERCTEDRECQSGACVRDEDSSGTCASTCGFDIACDGELRCTLDGLRFVCVEPTGELDNGDSCEDSRACTSGVCLVSPTAEGPRCAAACVGQGDCDGGQACVRLELGARACIEVLPDGAPCTANEACAGGFCVEDLDEQAKCASACVDNGCAADFFCVPDQDGNRVCMPRLDDRDYGEDCAVDRECQSGLCRRFVADEDYGTFCTEACAAAEPRCGPDQVCWEGQIDVCGPVP